MVATGKNTLFSSISKLVGMEENDIDSLNTTVLQTTSFCLGAVWIFVVINLPIMYPYLKYTYHQGLQNIMVLLIGGIPLALPNIMFLNLSFIWNRMAGKSLIVTNPPAIERLARVTMICTDTTGVVTKNKISVDMDLVRSYNSFTPEQVLYLASYACDAENEQMSITDRALLEAAGNIESARAGIEIMNFQAWDPVTAAAESIFYDKLSGDLKRVQMGMVGVVANNCTSSNELEDEIGIDHETFLEQGYTLCAVGLQEGIHDTSNILKPVHFIGMIPFIDPPRDDSRKAIAAARLLGIDVKLLYDGQLCQLKELGRRLGLADDRMIPARWIVSPPISPYQLD